jgi:hypothetical protein
MFLEQARPNPNTILQPSRELMKDAKLRLSRGVVNWHTNGLSDFQL